MRKVKAFLVARCPMIVLLLLLSLRLSAMDTKIPLEHLLPPELWSVVAEHLPGDQLFLHQLMYRPRIKLSTKVAKNIIDALEQKIEKALYVKEREHWRRNDREIVIKYAPEKMGYWRYEKYKHSGQLITDQELHKEISEFMHRLANIYNSAPRDNKKMLHELLWKRVLKKSYTALQNNYPGLEVRRPIDYTKVTTATIQLIVHIGDRRLNRHTINKLDSIGKCAIALTIILDDKKLINKHDYEDQLKQLVPELQIK